MFEFPNFAATALALTVCASFAATAAATQLEKAPPSPSSLIAPKAASMKINNVNCPGMANIKITVWSKQTGLVKVTLEQKGVGTVSTGVVYVNTAVKGGYKGIRSANVGTIASPSKMKYRLVATGNGKTRKTSWIKTKSCALSL